MCPRVHPVLANILTSRSRTTMQILVHPTLNQVICLLALNDSQPTTCHAALMERCLSSDEEVFLRTMIFPSGQHPEVRPFAL